MILEDEGDFKRLSAEEKELAWLDFLLYGNIFIEKTIYPDGRVEVKRIEPFTDHIDESGNIHREMNASRIREKSEHGDIRLFTR